MSNDKMEWRIRERAILRFALELMREEALHKNWLNKCSGGKEIPLTYEEYKRICENLVLDQYESARILYGEQDE